MEAKSYKSGQSDASLSGQRALGKRGSLPLDKTNPSYLHLALPVPWSFSLRSVAEAFPPPTKHNPQCGMENGAASSCVLKMLWVITELQPFVAGNRSRAILMGSSWKGIFFPGSVSNRCFTVHICPFGKARFGADTTTETWIKFNS